LNLHLAKKKVANIIALLIIIANPYHNKNIKDYLKYKKNSYDAQEGANIGCKYIYLELNLFILLFTLIVLINLDFYILKCLCSNKNKVNFKIYFLK
jgi:hypothetical protein